MTLDRVEWALSSDHPHRVPHQPQEEREDGRAKTVRDTQAQHHMQWGVMSVLLSSPTPAASSSM